MKPAKIVLCGLIMATTAMPLCAATDAAALIRQGPRFWQEQQLDAAEKSFRQASEADPASVDAHRKLAALYLSQNKSRKAIEEYQAAIVLRPEDPKLFLALAIAYLHSGSYSASQAMASEALRLDPGLKQALKVREYIHAKQEASRHASGAEVVSGTDDPRAGLAEDPKN